MTRIVCFESKDRLLSPLRIVRFRQEPMDRTLWLKSVLFGHDLYRFRFNRIKLVHALPFLYQFEFSTSIVAFQPHWFFSLIKTFQLHRSFSNFSCTSELSNFNLTFQLHSFQLQTQLFNVILSNFMLDFSTSRFFQLLFPITGTHIPNN